MMELDLRKVRELLNFKDLFATPEEYMSAANSLPIIELDTKPLYVLHPGMRVLFTPKLRYYALKTEYEINRHLNAVAKLLEDDGDNEGLAKYLIKKTRDAVKTLVNEADGQLENFDTSNLIWKSITSDTPDYELGVCHEEVAYYHYTIAELARCWLELQDRYAYIIGKVLYDVNLFYSTFLKRTPDFMLKLERTKEYDEEAKKFKKFRTDCCFLYDNEEYFAIAIQEFTNKLKQHGLISEDVDFKKMETLFRGHPTRNVFTWLGDKHILTQVIKGLCTDDKPVLTTWPEGISKWDVVSARFCDKEGNPMPNIRQESPRKKAASIVKELIDSLAEYK